MQVSGKTFSFGTIANSIRTLGRILGVRKYHFAFAVDFTMLVAILRQLEHIPVICTHSLHGGSSYVLRGR
jgi:hypothetical protein